MYRKYKIKKRRKIVSPYYIFIVFAIAILFVSTSYALLSDNLSIVGKANILTSDAKVYGNSTYTWSHFSSWANDMGGKTYQIEMPITNLDGDIDLWEVSFEVPLGCTATPGILWQASEVTVSGNIVTMKGHGWNGYLANGAELPLNLILPFETEVDFYITNIMLNGKYVNFIPKNET